MSDAERSETASRSRAMAKSMHQEYNLARNVDWIPVSAGIVVIIAAMLMYNQSTHTLPQTSTTFTVRPVRIDYP